ncbi:MAG: hypothetical protein IKU40_04570 [Clostridia bacterium]|nr:hypothetical protein [Clostridia bacterium]
MKNNLKKLLVLLLAANMFAGATLPTFAEEVVSGSETEIAENEDGTKTEITTTVTAEVTDVTSAITSSVIEITTPRSDR